MEIHIGSIGENVDVDFRLRDKEVVIVEKVTKDGKEMCLDTMKALGLLDEVITSVEEQIGATYKPWP